MYAAHERHFLHQQTSVLGHGHDLVVQESGGTFALAIFTKQCKNNETAMVSVGITALLIFLFPSLPPGVLGEAGSCGWLPDQQHPQGLGEVLLPKWRPLACPP